MGLNIHLGGVGADAGMAAGAGFAAGVPQGLEDGKAQAAADEMIQATKAIYAAELDRVDNLVPDLDAGKPPMTQASSPLGLGSVEMPKFLNPTKNKSQEQLDGLAAKYAEGIQGFTNAEAAKLYTQGSVASLDEAHSGMIRENLTASMSAAADSGAMTTEQLAPFLEGLAMGEDPREVYKEYRAFVSAQIESRRDAARVARHVGRMRTATDGFVAQAAADPENAAWYEQQAMEMDDLAVEAEESARYGNESLDSEALWNKYNEIKHRRTPAQDSIANQERIDDWMDTRDNMLKLNEDADTTVIDAKINHALGVRVHGGEVAGTDEAGNTFGPETVFPEQGVGASVRMPGGSIEGQAARVDPENSSVTPALASIERGLSSETLTPEQADTELVAALKSAGWDGETPLKSWMQTLPPEEQGNIVSTREKVLEAQAKGTPIKQAAPPASGGRTEVSALDDKQLFEQLLQDTAARWRAEGVSEKDIAKGIKQMREAE